MSHPAHESVQPTTARRLLATIARAQVTGRLPSIVAGVVRDGELVWCDGYGDVAGEPGDTQYKIGSITKTLTTVLILQLVEEGKLALDDPASTVLGDVGYGDRTIRSLLAHNSGMQAEPNGSWWERSPGVTFTELTAANDGTDAVLPVGQQFHYTNLAFGLLGEIAARLRGGTWWESISARILEPLGMSRTSYQAEGVHAQGTSIHPYSGEATAEPHPDTGAMAPAGQLWSTVQDLTTYCCFLLDGQANELRRSVRRYIPWARHKQHGVHPAMRNGRRVTFLAESGQTRTPSPTMSPASMRAADAASSVLASCAASSAAMRAR